MSPDNTRALLEPLADSFRSGWYSKFETRSEVIGAVEGQVRKALAALSTPQEAVVEPSFAVAATDDHAADDRPLRCLLAELDDVASWIERTKPQGLLYDSTRPALREATAVIRSLAKDRPQEAAGSGEDDWQAEAAYVRCEAETLDGPAHAPIPANERDHIPDAGKMVVSSDVSRLAKPGPETMEALALADRLLNRPLADPDDDLAVLSRQLLRAWERICQLAAFSPSEA